MGAMVTGFVGWDRVQNGRGKSSGDFGGGENGETGSEIVRGGRVDAKLLC